MTSSVPSLAKNIDALPADAVSANTVDIQLPLSALATALPGLASRTPPVGRLTHLDPNTVRLPSRPNRDESSFTSASYYELLESIRRAGGNIEPIKVVLRKPPSGEGDAYLEEVFGERRLHACREARLPVLAMVVDELDNQNAVVEQIAENSARDDFSPFELGRICLDALSNFGGSQKQMCARIGKGESEVSKAMALARLPVEIIRAFESTADLQYRHSKPLHDALAANRQAVIAEAVALTLESGPRSAAMVVARLTGAAVTPAGGPIGPSNTGLGRALRVNRRAIGRIFSNAEEAWIAEISRPLDKDEMEAVATAIEAALSACGAARRLSRSTNRKASVRPALPAGPSDSANSGAAPILQPRRLG
jgi:ParB/RepB/Spo0J family partition protein